MSLSELLEHKKLHASRLANAGGAIGELDVINQFKGLITRPKGSQLRTLLNALSETGIHISGTSFDAILPPNGESLDFGNVEKLREISKELIFVEIKSSKQKRVKKDFSGFFFAVTEKEILASEQLKERHIVILYNKLTGDMLQTTVPAILARSKSMNWQLSVQL